MFMIIKQMVLPLSSSGKWFESITWEWFNKQAMEKQWDEWGVHPGVFNGVGAGILTLVFINKNNSEMANSVIQNL